MTDEQLLRDLAEIEGYEFSEYGFRYSAAFGAVIHYQDDDFAPWNPIANDAQCLALVKKHHLTLEWSSDLDIWFATARLKDGGLLQCEHPNLNTAACLAIRAAHNI